MCKKKRGAIVLNRTRKTPEKKAKVKRTSALMAWMVRTKRKKININRQGLREILDAENRYKIYKLSFFLS